MRLFTAPRSAHRDHRTIAPAPRDTPPRRLSCHAFGAASVARSGSISRHRLRQPRPARPWPHPVARLTPNRPHRPLKRLPKVQHHPPLHHLGRVLIEAQPLRYARQRHQQVPVAPPYPDAGTLFPRSVCRDSRTETPGEHVICSKPGPSPNLRNRLRRSQGAAPGASAIGY